MPDEIDELMGGNDPLPEDATNQNDAVVIFVSGGVVQSVVSSIENLDVVVVDNDDIEDETTYYTERGYKNEQDMLDSLNARFLNL